MYIYTHMIHLLRSRIFFVLQPRHEIVKALFVQLVRFFVIVGIVLCVGSEREREKAREEEEEEGGRGGVWGRCKSKVIFLGNNHEGKTDTNKFKEQKQTKANRRINRYQICQRIMRVLCKFDRQPLSDLE